MSDTVTVIVDGPAPVSLVVVPNSSALDGAVAAATEQAKVDAVQAKTDAQAAAAQTASDRTATSADRVQTGLDRIATDQDAAATAADRVQTGADRVQTGQDRTTTGTARDTAVAAAANATASVANAAPTFSAFTGAAPSIAAWVTGAADLAIANYVSASGSSTATADASGNKYGTYRKRSGVAVWESDTLTGVDRRTTTLTGASDLVAAKATQLLTYASASSDTVLPEVSGVGPDGVEHTVRGFRKSDGATMFYTSIDGPGFTSAVPRVMAPNITREAYTGAGPIYPDVVMGSRAVAYFDASVGRYVLHDVLIRGDTGLVLNTGPKPLILPTTGINGAVSYGQSLAIGAGSRPALSTTQPYSNLGFVGGPRSISAGDTGSLVGLFENETGYYNDPLTNICGESPCSGAANYAVEYSARRYGLDPASFANFSSAPGNGGQPIANLVRGMLSYSRLLLQVTAAFNLATTAGRRFSVHVVFWTQGESDVTVTSAATYKAALKHLVVDLNSDIKAITGQTTDVHLLTYQTASNIVPDGFGIARVQWELTNEDPRIHFTTPTYLFPRRTDFLHFTYEASLWYGRYLGRAYAQLVVEGRTPDCIRPISATAQGTTLSVKYSVPTLPLVLDAVNLPPTTDMGCKVVDSSGTLTISSPQIVGGDTLQWTLNRAVVTAGQFRYALDYNGTPITDQMTAGGASGNLRDSTSDTALVNGVTRTLWHMAPHHSLPILQLAA